MPAKEHTVIGLDIGNHKIRAVIAVVDEGARHAVPNVIGVGISPSAGLRRGAIVDAAEAVAAITAALEDAERMAGEPIHHATVAVGGAHLSAFHSRGVIAVGGTGAEITESDVGRVLEAVQAVHLPANRKILRVVPQQYSVDDQHGIVSPVGMTGVRLEADALVITGLTPALKNLEHAVHQAGVDIDDLVPAPLAAAEAVLGKRQKELGVVAIDIGAGSTSLAVFEEGVLLATAVLPVGGESVTNDLAIGLRTSIDTAERLKIEYGSVQPSDISDRETIDLSALSRTETAVVGKRELASIAQARYQEILEMARAELKRLGRDGQLPAGAILTGGGAKIPGLLELARDTLRLPVTIGFPAEVDGVVEKIDDPSYATAVGLLLFGLKGPTRQYGVGGFDFGDFFGSLKSFFKKLLP